MGLQNPLTAASKKYTSSLRASYELIGAVTGKREFSTADHLQAVKEERQGGKINWDGANAAKLREIIHDQVDFKKSLFLRVKHMGSWMSVWVTTVTGTLLAATEFRDFYVHFITLTPITFK